MSCANQLTFSLGLPEPLGEQGVYFIQCGRKNCPNLRIVRRFGRRSAENEAARSRIIAAGVNVDDRIKEGFNGQAYVRLGKRRFAPRAEVASEELNRSKI
ncbi:hypothetical protein [Brevundimonas naejangsanensis]|uniref:hypothetical protein n=1 Tax=Brevundimonas naejangsanensis TaxID=588932 RepID=UPI001F0892E5|nr:hypothetical protein [Brevundimonas naejangsanensis]